MNGGAGWDGARRTGAGRLAGGGRRLRRGELGEGRDPRAARPGEDNAPCPAALDALESGTGRVVEPDAGGWRVNQWLKKAVLLSFRLTDSAPMAGPGGADQV